MNPSPFPADAPHLLTVVVNYQTPDLLERVVQGFRTFYPGSPLMVVDNGSRDNSGEVAERLRAESPQQTSVIINKKNLHHGPAMDQALRSTQAISVLFLDTDVEVFKGGFLEQMAEALERFPETYAVGHRININRRGFDVPSDEEGFPYIRPYCMLVKKVLYMDLPPFQRHGAPCLENMRSAGERGLRLVDFPVRDFVRHQGRGTASRFGYKLGVRGKVNYVMNKLGR